jgi:DNA-binding IclR family transcriptional regulator
VKLFEQIDGLVNLKQRARMSNADQLALPDPLDLGQHRAQLGIQSVEVAGALLQALLRADGPIKLVVLARAADMPPAKAHRYLVSLIRIGLATQDPVLGLYDLGPLALQLGLKGFTRFEPLRLAEATLRAVVAQVGETATLAVWSEQGPTYVRMIEARHEFASTIPPSHRCPLTYSATGLLFCALEDANRVTPAINVELAQNKRSGRLGVPHDRRALNAVLAIVSAQGFATVTNAGDDGYSAVSAPVFDVTGRLIMALTVFGRAGRVDAQADGALAHIVVGAAAKLSAALGYQGTRVVVGPSVVS